MNYIKKHLKWIIIFVVLLVVLCLVLLFGGKDEPITEKETKPQETTENVQETESSSGNGIVIEDEDPYADDGWSDIVYFD